MDPRGIKGAWEALVFYVNHEKTAGIRKLAADAQWFEDRMPWDPTVPEAGRAGHHRQRDRRRHRNRRLRADHAGRHQPAERSDDPREVRQQVGVARRTSTRPTTSRRRRSSGREFAWTPEEAQRAEKWSALAGELTTNMHEVIGHASGKIAERLKGSPQAALKEQYSALEEARADLVALYFLPDPKLVELGSSTPKDQHGDRAGGVRGLHAECARAAAPRARGHADRRRPHAQPPDDRALAHGATRRRSRCATRDGKTYYVMVDAKAFREGVGRLLAEVQRIKAEGDYAAAKKLFETLRHPLRPEAARRGRRARRQAATAVLHRLRAAESSSRSRAPTARSPTSQFRIRRI